MRLYEQEARHLLPHRERTRIAARLLDIGEFPLEAFDVALVQFDGGLKRFEALFDTGVILFVTKPDILLLCQFLFCRIQLLLLLGHFLLEDFATACIALFLRFAIDTGKVGRLLLLGARRLDGRRTHGRAFAAALHEAYPVRSGWGAWLAPDTIVCRCEEVPVSAIHEAVDELGAEDPRAAKLFARPGMGLCQGRVCGYATASVVTARRGCEVTPADLAGTAARPIAQPVPMSVLAADPGGDA